MINISASSSLPLPLNIPENLGELTDEELKWISESFLNEKSLFSPKNWNGAPENLTYEGSFALIHNDVRSLTDSGYESYLNAKRATTALGVDTAGPANEGDPSDNDTIYSIDTNQADDHSLYIDQFTRFLSSDLLQASKSMDFQSSLIPSNLPILLGSFARRLHAEAPSRTERNVSKSFHIHAKYV